MIVLVLLLDEVIKELAILFTDVLSQMEGTRRIHSWVIMSRIGATKTVTQATNPHTAATRRDFRRDFISGNGIARRKKDKRAGDVLCLRPASLIAFVLWVLTNYESSY